MKRKGKKNRLPRGKKMLARGMKSAKGSSEKQEDIMSVEFLLVSYSKDGDKEDRTVLADGNSVGVTNHILMLQAGTYQISLEGSGYAPKTQDIVLTGTSIMRPEVITFT